LNTIEENNALVQNYQTKINNFSNLIENMHLEKAEDSSKILDLIENIQKQNEKFKITNSSLNTFISRLKDINE